MTLFRRKKQSAFRVSENEAIFLTLSGLMTIYAITCPLVIFLGLGFCGGLGGLLFLFIAYVLAGAVVPIVILGLVLTFTGIFCHFYSRAHKYDETRCQNIRMHEPHFQEFKEENRIYAKRIIDKTAIPYLVYSPIIFLCGSFIAALLLKYSGI